MMNKLATLPPGIAESAELIAQLDRCLSHGLARLGSEHRQSLQNLAATFASSPLAQVLADAVAAVDRSEFVPRHFMSLAAARAALQGAQHDLLRAQLCEVCGIQESVFDEPTVASAGAAASLLSSTQQWLMELALAGFQHLEEASVAPFSATLEPLQAVPELTGLAALLTGLVSELLMHMPAERQASLPLFRWADLWTAAMIRTQLLISDTPYQQVSGTLTPYGLTVHSHDNFVSATLYGSLQTDDEVRTVRMSFCSYKVDVIAGAEIWELFGNIADPLLKALAVHKTLSVAGQLHANGDLRLTGKPQLGKAADPFAAATSITALPPPPALLRHPVHIDQVVYCAEPCELPLAQERMAAGTEIAEPAIRGAHELIALLRFDQGASRQPLCIRTSKGFTCSGESLQDLRKKLKTKTLAVLKDAAASCCA